ncbi:hypothetical protein QR680_002971 [Steinernema hermaphroditum]|uniref:3'-phosphate/5'-hydroxy nucleic acid ligase n=1 Tax=Steinernema hermaphroditum TaxID=289476 RepID=A0AA39H4X3_9BILA|nr:hypothetical protein QR680_002971 [Steinernema hermaphroditum]
MFLNNFVTVAKKRRMGGFLRSWGVSGTSDETSIGNGVYRRTMPEMFLLRFMQIDPHWLNFFFGKHPETTDLTTLRMPRTYEEELKFIERVSPVQFRIKKGFVPNMNVEGTFFVNKTLENLSSRSWNTRVYRERRFIASCCWAFHRASRSEIGNIAAFDVSNPDAVVSPGGVGFDINCGVRLIRTNLSERDVAPYKEEVAQSLFDHIPVGVGSKGINKCINPINAKNFEECFEMGMDWTLREGYSWPEDKEHCEEYGRMVQADASKVSTRARKRGLPQLGTLGAGNHYGEVQVVDEVYDEYAAAKMGIDHVATDSLVSMEKAMARDNIRVNDRQLACARINSQEGQDYLKGMAAAANFAWVNRSCMTFCVRQSFAKIFNSTPDDLDMHVIYDVSHNVAKMEEHWVDGKPKQLCVHRKGATRAFPAHHPLIPVDCQLTGQPVLIGGTMGTCSNVLTGTEKEMAETFGTTCHGEPCPEQLRVELSDSNRCWRV